ncbi:MAG: M20/M25/M40 family metallo-hydrolase [Candidatus Bathyarchaeia archaeon]
MDQTASVELLQKMLEFYSPSGKETEIALFLKDSLEKLGFTRVWTDRAGNVYGEIGHGSPTILLCGHMDTVPGRLPVKAENNRLYGRGAVDAKSSLAAMISAVASFKLSLKTGRIIVAGVVDEEGRARGIRQLIRGGLKVDYAIFGEPSGVKNVTFAYKGRLRLRMTCRTKSGHVGAQHLLSNAIEKSLGMWNRFKDYFEKNKSRLGIFYSISPCLIGISSRRTSGGIPDICVLDIDLRLPPTIKCKNGLELVKKDIERFQKENGEATITLKVIDKVEPFVADRNNLVMKALKEAIYEVTGEHASFLRKTGTGDMNIFGANKKIPIATYGPGDARLSHTSDECIDISEYLTVIQVYKKAIEKILLWSQVDVSSL